MTRRVRVLRVIARLNVGGPALHATLLAERLDPSRFESVLIAGVEGPHEGNYLSLHGRSLVNLVSMPRLGREIQGPRDVVALLDMIRVIRRFRPDIVHTHTAKAGALGRLAAHLARVPIIVHTYHGHVFHGYFSGPRTRLFVMIERWLGRRTDCLLAVSEAVRADLLARGIGDPARVVAMPLGLDLAPFLKCEALRGELRAELGFGPGALLVGIVARLVPIKAHEVFLEAAAALARDMTDVRFLVVGDGERRAELEQLAQRLGLGERTRFLGWRRDLDRVYADLDLVALTSRNEGSPVSLIEAMAAARPVVATRVGGVPDLVEDGVTGWLVPSTTPRALTETMRTVLGDREGREAIGAAARKSVAAKFSAERLLEDVERLYTRLLQEKQV